MRPSQSEKNIFINQAKSVYIQNIYPLNTSVNPLSPPPLHPHKGDIHSLAAVKGCNGPRIHIVHNEKKAMQKERERKKASFSDDASALSLSLSRVIKYIYTQQRDDERLA